jgi:hypothetical protein
MQWVSNIDIKVITPNNTGMRDFIWMLSVVIFFLNLMEIIVNDFLRNIFLSLKNTGSTIFLGLYSKVNISIKTTSYVTLKIMRMYFFYKMLKSEFWLLNYIL